MPTGQEKRARDYTLANMSNVTYDDNPKASAGWETVATKIDPKTGFAASAFQNISTKEVVIAYRGTDGKSDAGADMAIAGVPGKGNWDAQFTQGLDFTKSIMDKYPDAKISVTGHSLGGAHAEVASQMFGLPGTTFDPGGAKNLVGSKGFQEWAVNHGLPKNGKGASPDLENYVVNSSGVSNLSGAHVGKTTPLSGIDSSNRPVPSGWDKFTNGVREGAAMTVPILGAGVQAKKGIDDQADRHSMDRIERVFEKAYRTQTEPSRIGWNSETDNPFEMGQPKTMMANNQSSSPEVQALHDKIGGFLYPTLADAKVGQNHADAMVATAVQESVAKNISASEVMHAGIDKGKNLISVFSDQEFKFACFDAIAASKNDPEKTLAAAQQQLEQPQQQQLAQNQERERSGLAMG